MEHNKEALLQELRDRTPKSGTYWETAKDLVPGGLMSGKKLNGTILQISDRINRMDRIDILNQKNPDNPVNPV